MDFFFDSVSHRQYTDIGVSLFLWILTREKYIFIQEVELYEE